MVWWLWIFWVGFVVWGFGFVGYVGETERGDARGGWYGLFQACGLWVVAINRTIGKTANRVGCFVGKVWRHNGIR